MSNKPNADQLDGCLIREGVGIGGTKFDVDGYESVEDWLEDNGLRMMQDAMNLFQHRIEKLEDKLK